MNNSTRRMGLWLVLVMAGLLSSPTLAKPLSAVEMVEITRLSSPRQSPDGRYVAYKKRSTDWDKDRHVNQYYLHDSHTGLSAPILTPEKKGESFFPVKWAPDSQSFIVLLDRKSKKKNIAKQQAYLYNIQSKNLSLITRHPSSIVDVKWNPSGSGFYYRAGAFEQDDNAMTEMVDAIEPYDNLSMRQLWYIDLQSQQAQQIISGNFTVDSYSLSKDGKRILYAKSPSRLSDDRVRRELYIYDTGTKETFEITKNQYSEFGSTLSPDGTKAAFIATVDSKGRPYFEDNLFIKDIETGCLELILPKINVEVLSARWGKNSETIYFLGNSGLRNQIYQYDLKDKSLVSLTQGDHEVGQWSYNPETNSHLYIRENALNPGELFLLDKTSEQVALTDEFGEFNKNIQTAKQEAFYWRGKDGKEVEGLLIYPLNYEKNKVFPLITITHGGPRTSAQYGSWNVSRAVNVFAGEGYGLFLPNHRGGTGYGDDFMRDMVGGYFNKADDDILKGIDALIDAELADPKALFKMGWSAGGHMTNWLVTQTDRFKAASSGAGASDWVSMYAESDVRYMRTFNFGGTPWQRKAPLKTYQKNSPLYQAYKIKTPILFWAGEKDIRVPPTQSIMMYRATKSTGVETNLYLAKGEPHNFKKPSHQLFKINTELAWFAKHNGLGAVGQMAAP